MKLNLILLRLQYLYLYYYLNLFLYFSFFELILRFHYLMLKGCNPCLYFDLNEILIFVNVPGKIGIQIYFLIYV